MADEVVVALRRSSVAAACCFLRFRPAVLPTDWRSERPRSLLAEVLRDLGRDGLDKDGVPLDALRDGVQ